MIRDIRTYRIDWQGRDIEISYEPNWLSSADPRFVTAHIQVQSLGTGALPLPITETGYRSHFVPPDEVLAAGGPVAYVRAWLDAAAQESGWREREMTARQLSLF